jgi:GTP-binding protein HflX
MTQQNTAILVALGNARNVEETQEHLDELAFLAETAGIQTIRKVVQNLPTPDARTFIGKEN